MSALELLVVEVSKDIKFTLTDSGPPPNTENYTTLLIVHGHTYHAGMSSVLLDFSELKADLDLFKKLGPLAKASAVRVICVNRREYNGSTPHTPEELRVYKAGSDEERTMLLSEEGRNLALCMDAVIQKCALPAAGHVALVGWSLGNTFTMAVMASIASLPYDSKYRLKESIKSFILWDPPSQALGIEGPENPYVPLYDTAIPPAARGQAFGVWVASYFSHNLAVRDEKNLQRKPQEQPPHPPTFHDLPIENLLAMTDFSVGDKCDTAVTEPPFRNVVDVLVDKALFRPETREAWGHPRVAYMWGEANAWNVPWAVWDIERRVQDARGEAPITFRAIPRANHFLMCEDAPEALKVLIECTHSGVKNSMSDSSLT
ncbi:Alpha/Beta hydrolase protein [Mycena rebaudengoi]|nr:Alpha/Beta hydrolase protein [Mycena rebaudengoi]